MASWCNFALPIGSIAADDVYAASRWRSNSASCSASEDARCASCARQPGVRLACDAAESRGQSSS